jgi:hypothetical protein
MLDLIVKSNGSGIFLYSAIATFQVYEMMKRLSPKERREIME